MCLFQPKSTSFRLYNFYRCEMAINGTIFNCFVIFMNKTVRYILFLFGIGVNGKMLLKLFFKFTDPMQIQCRSNANILSAVQVCLDCQFLKCRSESQLQLQISFLCFVTGHFTQWENGQLQMQFSHLTPGGDKKNVKPTFQTSLEFSWWSVLICDIYRCSTTLQHHFPGGFWQRTATCSRKDTNR